MSKFPSCYCREEYNNATFRGVAIKLNALCHLMLLMVRRLNNIISHFCIRLAFQDLDPGSYSLEGRLPERWSRGHTKGCLLGAIFFTVFEIQKVTILFDALFLFLFRLQATGKAK